MALPRLTVCSLSVFLLVALLGLSAHCASLPQEDDLQSYALGNPKEICNLPMKVGFCRARMPRYMYDPRVQDCVKFYYGGCSGNANNFSTKDKCLQICAET